MKPPPEQKSLLSGGEVLRFLLPLKTADEQVNGCGDYRQQGKQCQLGMVGEGENETKQLTQTQQQQRDPDLPGQLLMGQLAAAFSERHIDGPAVGPENKIERNGQLPAESDDHIEQFFGRRVIHGHGPPFPWSGASGRPFSSGRRSGRK